MPLQAEVRISGFNQLHKALKAMDVDLDRELKDELKNSSVMYRLLADARKGLTASIGQHQNVGLSRLRGGRTSELSRGSRSTGRAAASIRVGSTTRGVYIAGGKATVPYYGWLDFGGNLKPTGGRHNLQPRPFFRRGRAIYPAIDKNRPEIHKALNAAVDTATKKAGLS